MPGRNRLDIVLNNPWQPDTALIDWIGLWQEQISKHTPLDCCQYHLETLEGARRFDEEIQAEERAQVEEDIEAFGLAPRDRVLEIGSGPGTYTIPLARRVGQVVAVEPLESMRQVLSEKMAKASLTNITFVPKRWEDVDENLDLSPPYDLVVATFSLTMLDIRAAVAKMGAVSGKTVCLYWFIGPSSCDQRGQVLWPALYGCAFHPAPKADILLNVLFDMSIYPQVVVFPFQRTSLFASFDQALAEYRRRFGVPAGGEAEEAIRQHLARVLVRENGVWVQRCWARCVKIWWDVSGLV